MYAVASAQLPEPPTGADRLFVTPNAVIVLDGASAFGPANPDPADYVDRLGGHLHQSLTRDPGADLREALASAIKATADELELTPGLAPSSTVAIARWIDDRVDLLVLGDSQITTPHGDFRDGRMDTVGESERTAYRDRLAEGHGYDEAHRELVVALQTQQALRRNRPDGYWIAEANPVAAAHALTESYAIADVPWMVLATDGAYRVLDHLDERVPTAAGSEELASLLRRLQRWEGLNDPDGIRLPRSKRHDDKLIVVATRVA